MSSGLGEWEKGIPEEGVPENLSVPLEGDRDFGELCGSHQGHLAPLMRPTKFPEIPVSLERNTEVFRHPLL